MNAQFGVIGLGVMGRSIARNLAQKGFQLSLYNRHVAGKEENIARDLQAAHPELAAALPFDDLADFVESLPKPRKILIMVNAGEATDAVMNDIWPLLSANDILIDGGNAHYKDTQKRIEKAEKADIHWLGCGISGGEKGALEGPSIMCGGHVEAYQQVEHILTAIAARDNNGTACCAYIGKGGAGHFVKMVHNGIEYAEMQLIAEVYSMIYHGMLLPNAQAAEVFLAWMDGDESSYLLEISAAILQKKEGEKDLIDQILDKAGNKGTGSWATIAAAELGVPATMITTALFARYISGQKAERINAENLFPKETFNTDQANTKQLKKAYRFARLINHHQGFELLKAASETYQWQLNMAEIARIWTSGCIIRSVLMELLAQKLKKYPEPLAIPYFQKKLLKTETSVFEVMAEANFAGIPIPCISEAHQYFMSLRTANGSANMLQAQRDYFGAHTYKRKDDPDGKNWHTDWEL